MISSSVYIANLIAASCRQGDIWDLHTIDETWHVEKVDKTGMKVADAVDVLTDASPGGPVIRAIGEAYTFTGGTGITWLESAMVRSLSWQFGVGRGANVQVNYSTRYFWANDAKGMGTGVEDPASATVLSAGLFLPCGVLPIFQSRNVVTYRDGAGMTNPPPGLDISTSDIGGSQKRIDRDVKQIGVKLRMYIDVNSLGIQEVVDIVSQYLGMKNSAMFLGFITGSLVCSGAAINHLENEMFELVIEYLFDEHYHHTQMPTLATDGKPKMNGTNYTEVFWTRPVRGAVNFNDIWPTGDLGKSQKYQAYMGRWY